MFGRIPCPVSTRTLEPARALAAETLRQERTLSDLLNQACGLTPAEIAPVGQTAPPDYLGGFHPEPPVGPYRPRSWMRIFLNSAHMGFPVWSCRAMMPCLRASRGSLSVKSRISTSLR